MPNYWFFFSYATTDGTDPYLKKFYLELARLVRSLAGMPADVREDNIGFFASESIRTGEAWPQTLIEGLQVSKVLVCLLSPSYVRSYVPCGCLVCY